MALGRDRMPSDQTVFLVSGGAKGITAACVIALARRYRSRFILVGRSRFEANAEPAWAADASSEADLKRLAMGAVAAAGERPTPRRVQQMVAQVTSQREIAATLDAIAEAGGTAVYVAADVTDGPGLTKAVAEAGDQVGAVNGIVHGAGLLADKLVQDKSAADFDRVVSVKVDGLRNLLACVPSERLEFLVLFSSVAGFYGNTGQADYAVANEVLNKVAHWVRAQSPGCHVVSVDWGPWDGGMVTPELKKQLALRDIKVIGTEEGTEILADLLRPRSDAGRGSSQVMVGSPMLPPLRQPPTEERTYHIRRRLRVEDNPFLLDHIIGGKAVLPTVCAVAWMANACEQLYPGYQFLRVDDYRALKGIVFDEDLAAEHTLDLRVRTGAPEISAADDRRTGGPGESPVPSPIGRLNTVEADALIWSDSGGDLPRYHYRAQVTLCRTLPDAPTHPVPDAGVAPVLRGSDLYAERRLFHGPGFQGVREILALDETGLTMKCELPRLSSLVQGQFPVQMFNPYVVDVQLQSLLVWANHFYGYGGLPLRIRQGVQYLPLRFGETTYASMYVRSRSPRSLVADVLIYDEAGIVHMEVRGAEITLSERLNTLFEQNRLAIAAPVGNGTS